MQRTCSIRRIPKERRVGSLPASRLIPVARTNMSDSSNVKSSSRERNAFEGNSNSIDPTFKTNANPAIDYAKHRSRSHRALIRVYNAAGNLIETHEHAGDFKESLSG